MRNAALTLLCIVACGYAMNAQFSLLPQVGFENSKTNISYNDFSSFAPEGVQFTPQASLRLNYASKSGHGFFLGAATSRSTIAFSFTDPENGMNSFASTAGNMQLRLEGGYLFNSKPISLNKAKQTASKSKSTAAKKNCSSYAQRSNCQKSYSSNKCSGSRYKSNQTSVAKVAKNKGSWLRIQPSIGMGFIPAVKTDVVTKTQNNQTTYEYSAGNWQTGLIAGSGFEFGKGNVSMFTVSINYFQGLGNLDKQTLTTTDGAKITNTTLQSSVSGWSLKVGVPISLSKKPVVKNKIEKKIIERKAECQQLRIIKYRCTKN